MKKMKVKGFTLIELIVVMAIFSIILFGAMSLMVPSQKIMLNAEHMENGNAAVNGISKYIETEISAAEFFWVSNEVTAGAPVSLAGEFGDAFYKGIVAPNSVPGSVTYGKGRIHVMEITNDCQIEKWVYEYNYENGNVTEIDHYNYAVNKAYYNSYAFEILPGNYPSVDVFDTTMYNYEHGIAGFEAAKLMENIGVKNTSFCIKATTLKKCTSCGVTFPQGPDTTVCPNGHTVRSKGYAFIDNASMSLINLAKHRAGAISGHYFVVDTRMVDDDGDPSTPDVPQDYIADRSDDSLTNYPPIFSGFKKETGGAGNGYTFVYSYGSEQLLP